MHNSMCINKGFTKGNMHFVIKSNLCSIMYMDGNRVSQLLKITISNSNRSDHCQNTYLQCTHTDGVQKRCSHPDKLMSGFNEFKVFLTLSFP